MMGRSKAETLMRAFAWFNFIFLNVISLIPVPELVGRNLNDLFLHFIAYGGVMWSFTQGYPESRMGKLMVGLAVWGALLEVVQGMTSYRLFEWADIAANTTGVILGWAFSRIHKPVSQFFKMSTVE